ncbi:restriction endonuclease subunit S [Bradyrhizobium japonicum]|uniref:restriction endonuclease subunit S n=1 Tax=Bradyrhizobium japonicum TaxID=375 RepID=UPI000420C94F|nr:restriction endonuclease subunit S [Bradyrhizobium japonicum]
MDLVVGDQSQTARNGLWALPEGWVWMPLGALGTWTGGGTPSKANALFWENGTVPWVSPKDMKVEIIGETEDKITPEAVASSSAKYVPEGSVLMVMRSGILRHSFPVAVTDRVVTLNQDLRALAPRAGIDPRYIARYLALATQRVLHECSKDGTTVNSIEVSALERLPVPLAPLSEQRRIVARIDALFSEIGVGEAALVEARKGLETFRRALLKAAVTGELTKDWRAANPTNDRDHDLLACIERERAEKASTRGRSPRSVDALPPDARTLPALPDGWIWETLERLSWASSYGTSVKCAQDAHGDAVLRIPNIRGGEIVYGDLKFATTDLRLTPNDFVAPGDLLVIRTNGSETLIGRGGICDRKPDQPTYFASYLIRFRLLGDGLIWRWVSNFFESPPVRQWMTRKIASSAGQYNVSQSNLASLPIPVPPFAEMSEILRRISDAVVTSADTLAHLEAEVTDAARLKQSILKAAFEGRLVPQHAADEPASVLLARFAADRIPAKRAGAKSSRSKGLARLGYTS